MVQRVVVPYHPPSGEPVGIFRPSVALPQKVQRFVVPHFSQTTPNHRPENLRSDELPTGSKRECTLMDYKYHGSILSMALVNIINGVHSTRSSNDLAGRGSLLVLQLMLEPPGDAFRLIDAW